MKLQIASQLYSEEAESKQTDSIIAQLRSVTGTLQARLFEEQVQVSYICISVQLDIFFQIYLILRGKLQFVRCFIILLHATFHIRLFCFDLLALLG